MNKTIVLKSGIMQMYDQLQAYNLNTSFIDGTIEVKFEGSPNPYWGCSIEQNSDGTFRLKSMALAYPIDRTVTNQNVLGVISFLSGQPIVKKEKKYTGTCTADLDNISDLFVEYHERKGRKSTFKGTWDLPADEDEADEIQIVDVKFRGVSLMSVLTSEELDNIEGQVFAYYHD
jgi:hypothetical protein